MREAPLYVYFEDKEIGQLSLDRDQRFIFQYSSEWLELVDGFPLSLSMPLDERLYENEAHAYFTNLLPEGELRNLICEKLKVSENNHYELLRRIGGECAGAIRILQEDADLNTLTDSYQLIEKLVDAEVLIGAMVYGHQANRLSLAGAQFKLPVFYNDEKFYLPKNGSASSHILKFPSSRYRNLPTVEMLSTALVQQSGLDCIEIDAVPYDKNKLASLSKRFDRSLLKDKIIRVHQEDFCQVIGKLSFQKYEGENGPTLKDCFDVIDKFSSIPIIDKKKLMESTILNVLIGNCDAHAKNISYLFEGGQIKLSPLYDIVSTLTFPKLSTQMAMSLGGEKSILNVKKSNWEKWADEVSLNSKLVLGTVEKMAIGIIERGEGWCHETSSLIPEQQSVRVYKRVLKQTKNILHKL